MGFTIVNSKSEKSQQEKTEFEYLVDNPQWTLDDVTLSTKILNQIDEMIAYIQNTPLYSNGTILVGKEI